MRPIRIVSLEYRGERCAWCLLSRTRTRYAFSRQHHGYEALSAGTVEQSIALLEGDQKPDLLFTDLGLRFMRAAKELFRRKTSAGAITHA